VSNKILAIAGVVLVVLSGMWVRSCESKSLAEAQAKVNAAHDSLVVVQKEVERSRTIIALVIATSKHDSARADSLAKKATASAAETEHLKAKLRNETAPSAHADLDSLIAGDSATIHALQGAVVAEKSRGDSLQVGLTDALISLARLSAAAGRLDTASHVLVHASKPSFWAKLTPKPMVSVTAGINTRMQFDAVAGLGLGWSF
jgi:hypothetical protein